MASGVPIDSAGNHRCHTLVPNVWSGDEDEVARVKKRNRRGAERRSLRSRLVE